jgi:hypothetical protein
MSMAGPRKSNVEDKQKALRNKGCDGMGKNELLAYRRKLFRDATAFRKPDRVPHMSNFLNWVLFESGLGLTKGYENPALVAEVQKELVHRYDFDMMHNVLMLAAHPKSMTRYIGQGYNSYHEESGVVDLNDLSDISFDEFDELMANSDKFMWEKVFPKKFENWNKATFAELVMTIRAHREYLAAVEDTETYWREECGFPTKGFEPVNFGIERLFAWYTGMRATSIEMRRNPKRLREICDFYDEPFIRHIEETSPDSIPNRETLSFDFFTGMVAQNFMSVKQFEMFSWPVLKKTLDHLAKHDMTAYIYVEGSMMRFAELFKDIPKGVLALHLDDDDIYEVREALPNICLCGGLEPTLLGNGTPEQCVRKTRQLIDDLGREGGFILSESKMVSFLTDAKPENVKAVCDFASTYTL